MSQEQFDTLVERLEQEAVRNPGGYRLKLGVFGALGYFYVFGILLLLVALVGGLIYAATLGKGLAAWVIKIVIAILVLIGMVARSLWVRLEPPDGLELARRDLPQLFAAIDEVRAAARAPHVHSVLATNDLNAAVVQIPRLGLFGWQKNYLLLGLPLLQLMSVEEFKAVLAHEFGHLSGAHGRFGAWIYRVRESWGRLAAALKAEEHWGSFLFVPFFSWYAPKFAAWSFVQARQQEYEADRLAAETAGSRSIASALVRLRLKSEELARDFWPGIMAAADTQPEPGATPFRSLSRPERRRFLPDAPQTLERALGRNTGTDDTHPCLRERIRALAADAVIPEPVEQSAAEALFGRALDGLIDHFDRSWRHAIAAAWRGRHEFAANARERLAAFAGRTLNDEELEESARLTEGLHGEAQAMPLFEELLRRKPDYPVALFNCGRLLLARGDPAGVALIEEAMLRAPDAILAGCDVIVGYLREQGRDAEARRYVDRYWERREAEQRAWQERQTVRTDDVYVAHGMPPQQLTALVARIEATPGVKRAWLVRKDCRLSSEPLYVVGFQWTRWGARGSKKEAAGVAQDLAHDFNLPMEVFFLPLTRENRGFRKIFRRLEGSCIYPR